MTTNQRVRPIHLLAQAGLASAIFVFAPAASCDGGDRNMTGSCPAGEVCSTDTEDGLHFLGPVIGDGFFDVHDVKTLATGGTETVTLEETIDGDRHPFARSFDAAVDGDAASVEARNANVLVLRGGAPTDSYLRVTDPADGSLYDRLRIASRTIETITLARTFGDLLAKTPADDDVLYAPGATAQIALHDAGGSLLVDDAMRITGSGITQSKWDQLVVGNLAPGAHAVTVMAAGQTAQVPLTIAAGPDRLEPAFGVTQLEVEVRSFVCFTSLLGTRYIHVPWTFTADNADLEPSHIEGCTMVRPRSEGTVVIHVNGGGLTVDQAIPSVPASRRAPARDALAELRARVAIPGAFHQGDTAGERAAMGSGSNCEN